MKQSKTKIGLLLLVGVMLCGLLMSCGSEYDNYVTSQCKDAITAVDQYLDGKISFDSVNSKLDSVYDKIKNSESSDSLFAGTDVLSLRTKLHSYHMDETSSTYDELIDARNDLASTIGESKR